MSKYGFDLEICNILCGGNEMLCNIVDELKSNKIDYKTFLKKRLSVYIHLKNLIENEIFNVNKLIESEVKKHE